MCCCAQAFMMCTRAHCAGGPTRTSLPATLELLMYARASWFCAQAQYVALECFALQIARFEAFKTEDYLCFSHGSLECF
jgi:hypothetical protein